MPQRSTPLAGGYRIGQVAEETGLSHQTIRRLDAAGLLHPSRSPGGFRLYSERDVRRLVLVRQMRALGFTSGERNILIDVVAQLESGPEPDVRRALVLRLGALIGDAERRREVLRRQIGAVDRFISEIASAGAVQPD